MITAEKSRARAVADRSRGELVATVEVAASPQRVFRALTSNEIIHWWVRPGVFDTREWSGDVQVGGRWIASGMSRGQRYEQSGAFLEIDPPHRLVQTWEGAGTPMEPSIVTYVLEQIEHGTRLTLRQSGFASPEKCEAFAIGWETSFERLAELLGVISIE